MSEYVKARNICKETGRPCEYAVYLGYCSQTACKKSSYTINATEIGFVTKDENTIIAELLNRVQILEQKVASLERRNDERNNE